MKSHVRYVGTRLLLALLVFGCTPVALLTWPSTAQGQTATYAIRYQGVLFVSRPSGQGDPGSPIKVAPAGTPISVITVVSNTITLCGSGVTNDRGGYTIDIAPKADVCVQSRTGQAPNPGHIFLVKGENVHAAVPPGPPRLDTPSSLGQTQNLDLRATDIPWLTWTGGDTDFPALRFYGTLHANNRVFAGETVQFKSYLDQVTCGPSATTVAGGRYVVDIPRSAPAPSCLQRTNQDVVPFYAYSVGNDDGGPLGPVPVSPRLDQSSSLGLAWRGDLIHPCPPPQGGFGVEGSPPQLSVQACEDDRTPTPTVHASPSRTATHQATSTPHAESTPAHRAFLPFVGRAVHGGW